MVKQRVKTYKVYLQVNATEDKPFDVSELDELKKQVDDLLPSFIKCISRETSASVLSALTKTFIIIKIKIINDEIIDLPIDNLIKTIKGGRYKHLKRMPSNIYDEIQPDKPKPIEIVPDRVLCENSASAHEPKDCWQDAPLSAPKTKEVIPASINKPPIVATIPVVRDDVSARPQLPPSEKIISEKSGVNTSDDFLSVDIIKPTSVIKIPRLKCLESNKKASLSTKINPLYLMPIIGGIVWYLKNE